MARYLCFKVKRKAKELLPELLSTVPSLANREEDKRIGESAVMRQSPDWLSKLVSLTFYDFLLSVTKCTNSFVQEILQSKMEQEFV